MTKSEIPQMQLVKSGEPSVGLMLSGLIESIQKGETTPQTVEVLKGFMDLYERDQARLAERQFNAAFVNLQKEMPTVHADKMVTGTNGVVMYRYASAEEIHNQIQPYLIANGFSVSSSQKMEGDRVTATATLMHTSGHSKPSEFTSRIGKGAPGMNETKCDLATSTIAEREALCNLLNIPRSSREDDARMIGSPIGSEMAEDLRIRVQQVGADKFAFLKFAGAATFEEISDERWPVLDELLKRKEAAKAAREKLSPEGTW